VLLVNSMLPASASVPGCYADVGPDKPPYIRIAVCHNEDAIFAYDEIMLLAQTLEKAQSTDPQTVQDTFETLTAPGSLQSIFGAAYVGGLETTGVNRVLVRPSSLSHVVNGNGEFIGMFPRDIP
jgi:hypothetical protein